MANIKGVALVGIVDALRALGSEVTPYIDRSVHHYLDRRVLANKWYPEEDYRRLVTALGNFADGRVPGDPWEFLGEEGGKTQFKDVYVLAVCPDDPVGTLQRTGTTWSLYHDTGRVEVDIDPDRRRATLQLHDYPMACKRLCKTTTGYVRELLRQSGAADVQVELVACPPPNLGPVVWQIKWSVPE